MPRNKVGAKGPKSRAPRGSGSVYLDARRKVYVGKAIVGRNPDTGKPVYEYVRAKTQAEAVRLKAELIATRGPVTSAITVAEWATRWLDSLEAKPQTKDEYTTAVKYRIVPSLGKLRLTEVTTFVVEQAVRQWGTGEDGGAASTVRKWMATLSGMFQAALRAELIPRNPVRAAKRPPHTPTKFDLFTADDVRKIIAAAHAEPRHRAFALIASTGCRIGEAMALRSGDYVPATGLLTIAGTRTRAHGIGTPKSHHGTRTIRVPLKARAAVAAGIPTAVYTVQRNRWNVFLDRLGIRRRGMHQLRHTLASHWLSKGVPVTEIAKYLGDAPETVMRIYCHATGEIDPSEVTDELLGGGKVAPAPKKPKKPSETPRKS